MSLVVEAGDSVRDGVGESVGIGAEKLWGER